MPLNFMCRSSCVAIMMVAACADNAATAGGNQLCYSRAYSSEHLKSHPNQQVVKISAYTEDRGDFSSYVDRPDNRGSFFNSSTITLVATVRATNNPLFSDIDGSETSQLTFECRLSGVASGGSEDLECGAGLTNPSARPYFSASLGSDRFVYRENSIGNLKENPLFRRSISGVENEAYPGLFLDSSRTVSLGAEMFCDNQACADRYKPVSYVMSRADVSVCESHAASARSDW